MVLQVLLQCLRLQVPTKEVEFLLSPYCGLVMPTLGHDCDVGVEVVFEIMMDVEKEKEMKTEW